MTVLGIDTATEWTAVGLSQGDEVVAERSAVVDGGHASCLPELVGLVLADATIDLSGVDRLAVSIGPGSFTGLRVGLGFAKGLALASGLPMTTVDSLAVLALSASDDGRVAACLDARKREVYLALYEISRGSLRSLVEPAAMTPERAVETLAGHPVPDVIVGNGVDRYPLIADGIGARWIPLHDAPPRGGVVARLGAVSAPAREVASLVPFYGKPPAAQVPRELD